MPSQPTPPAADLLACTHRRGLLPASPNTRWLFRSSAATIFRQLRARNVRRQPKGHVPVTGTSTERGNWPGGAFSGIYRNGMCVAMCVDHVSSPSDGRGGEANEAGVHFLQDNGLVVEILAQAILRLPQGTSTGLADELHTACRAADVPEEDCHPGPSLDRQRLLRPQKWKSDHGTPTRAGLAWPMRADYATAKGVFSTKRQPRLRN